MAPKRDYRFVDKNPIIDLIRTAYLDSNMVAHEVAHRAGINTTTLDNWLYGKTLNPQVRTYTAVMDVLGIDVKFVYRSTGQELELRPGVGRKFGQKSKLKVVKGGKKKVA